LKTVLKIILALAIFGFVVVSIIRKTGEKETQIALTHSQSHVNTDIVDNQTQRMLDVNNQAAGLLNGGPSNSTTKSNTNYTPYVSGSDNEFLHLIVTGSYTINPGRYFGCSNQDLFRELLKYSARTDARKFDKLMQKGLSNGDCTWFETSEIVILEELSGENSAARVSRSGDNRSWWTEVSAIK
jgi:hypothetical protein